MNHCWCTALVKNGICQASSQHDPADAVPIGPIRSLYIAGPMTGYVECNFPAFYKAAKNLQEAGFQTVNPADNNTGSSYREILRGDIELMMACDGIATLPGWMDSKGASLEVQIGLVLQKKVLSVEQWIANKEYRGADAD